MNEPSLPRRRRLRRIATIVVVVLVAALGLGAIYLAIPQANLPEAAAALASTDAVAFTEVDGDLEFTPRSAQPSTGLVLYPGGKVAPAAYAPAAREIAAAGFLVVVVSVPFNLAVLDVDAATRVVERHLDVDTWAVGGHSLGGSMAAEYALRQPHVTDGLVLWASYSAADLRAVSLEALVVYGSLDGGANRFASVDSLSKLPPPPSVVVIEGGNHEQMGWYTGQANDPEAAIDRAEQQRQLVGATVSFLGQLGD